jgi:hypothetical protein
VQATRNRAIALEFKVGEYLDVDFAIRHHNLHGICPVDFIPNNAPVHSLSLV